MDACVGGRGEPADSGLVAALAGAAGAWPRIPERTAAPEPADAPRSHRAAPSPALCLCGTQGASAVIAASAVSAPTAAASAASGQ